MPTPYYRLKIKSLKFISAVDAGAQGPIANVALIKRAATGDDVDATCRVYKVDESLGLVFGWALASSLDGGATPHVDLQNDAIVGDDELIKIAAEFMESGGPSDVLHDENPDGKIVFMIPLTKSVADALGIQTKIHGLAIAMKPSPETFKRFVKKELNAFSIGGIGERELVAKIGAACGTCGGVPAQRAQKAAAKCAGCSEYMKSGDTKCAKCGKEVAKTRVRARKLIGRRAFAAAPAAPAPAPAPEPLAKRSVLTSEVDGHAHSIELTAPANGWWCGLQTSSAISEGETTPHQHAWSYDPETGAIEIAMDSGHSHTVADVVPLDVRQRAAEREEDQSDGKCESVPDGDDGGSKRVVVINARAPEGISTPSEPASSVDVTKQESTEMADANDQIRELQRQNARLTKQCSMTDAERAHFAKLSGDAAESFLNLNPPQRKHALDEIQKANVVVYVAKSGANAGREYRMSDSTETIEAAKTIDAMNAELDVQKARTRDLEFAKRGAELLCHFAKGVKGNLQARIVKALHTEFSDAGEYEEATKALGQANAALAELTKAHGYTPNGEDSASNTPTARLNAAVAEFAKRNNVPLHLAMERATATDPEIRRLYNEASTTAGN